MTNPDTDDTDRTDRTDGTDHSGGPEGPNHTEGTDHAAGASPTEHTAEHDPDYCELPTPKHQRTPSTRSSAPIEIRDDADRGRFVAEVAGAEAFIQYRRESADILHLIRTWVPPEARGGGIGALLAEYALEHAREEGLKVTTSCWFVDQFIDASPQYQDLRAS